MGIAGRLSAHTSHSAPAPGDISSSPDAGKATRPGDVDLFPCCTPIRRAWARGTIATCGSMGPEGCVVSRLHASAQQFDKILFVRAAGNLKDPYFKV